VALIAPSVAVELRPEKFWPQGQLPIHPTPIDVIVGVNFN
jgi:hypothetical protein